MNKTNVAIALLDNVSAVEVTFPRSNGKYTYLAKDSLNLQIGDKVVVDTPQSGFVVVEVTQLNVGWDIDANYTYKFVVQRVDTGDYDKLNEAVAQVREDIERSRKEQAREQLRNMLNLKADTVARIAELNKALN